MMEGKTTKLLDCLIERPAGITSEDARDLLGVTPSTFRGMIRDLSEVLQLAKAPAKSKTGRPMVRHYLLRH